MVHKPNFNLSNIRGLYQLSMNPQMALVLADRVANREEEPFFNVRYFNGVFLLRFNLSFCKLFMQKIKDKGEQFNCITSFQFTLENATQWDLNNDFFLERLSGLIEKLDRDTSYPGTAIEEVATVQLPWKGAEILLDVLEGSEQYFIRLLREKLQKLFDTLEEKKREQQNAEPAPRGYTG